MSTALVFHGHFYQPPRENPWTGIVDREPSAAPFHDWNERITRECYRPNGWARILDPYGRVLEIVDNYEHINFNFGPTLLSWLERTDRTTYDRILSSDRRSAEKHAGHGNAITQAYNHSILPLCNDRDRRTQILWGIADFRHRFGREPESLWLPETACDDATLGDLIEAGMRYVILAPNQAARVRRIGEESWHEVGGGQVDPGVPYRYFHRDGSGRSIVLFFYDGPISRSIAFEGALASSQALIQRLRSARGGEGRLVHVATDGETYGHHTKYGDRSLAHALAFEAHGNGFWLTNYGEYLDHHPPGWEAEIEPGPDGKGTSWSCAHGTGRWVRDCGCSTGAQVDWNQKWRTPLRDALNFLSDISSTLYQSLGADLFENPWDARDEAIALILGGGAAHDSFLDRHGRGSLRGRERERALTLLEMQRHSMTMYTSCGWFFADISGIETVQVMKYAGLVMDLMDDLGHEPPRSQFLEYLAEAKSNIPEMGNGADIYRRFVEPARTSAPSVAAHLAITGLVARKERAKGSVAGYEYRRKDVRKKLQGRITLSTGRFTMQSIATERKWDLAFAAIHFGGIDFYCVLRDFPGRVVFREATASIWEAFPTAQLPALLRVARDELGPDEFGLEHVLPSGRHQISELVFGDLLDRFAQQYDALYAESRRLIEMLHSSGYELPPELRAAAEFTLGRRLEAELDRYLTRADRTAYHRAIESADEIRRRGYRIDQAFDRHQFGMYLHRAIERALEEPGPDHFRAMISLLDLRDHLGFEPDLDRAQEMVFRLGPDRLPVELLKTLAIRLHIAPNALTKTREPDVPPARARVSRSTEVGSS